MVEILLSVVPFGDVKHTGETILRTRKQLLAGYGVGQYECSFTASGDHQAFHGLISDNQINISRLISCLERP
jgi:hypothetical protein